jgi:L-histidine N-alpha-methyltransferase
MNSYRESLLDQGSIDAADQRFRIEVLAGLAHFPKSISPKFFYDQTGCRLFDEICELEEYYPSRAELGLMKERATEICSLLGPHCRIVELGSGSSIKTRVLLDSMISPAGYIPVDIAEEHLLRSATELERSYPNLTVKPVAADFTLCFEVPQIAAKRTVIFFPGSTIGNLEPENAIELLSRMARLTGKNGGLLIGVDLKKDQATLERAYNDSKGVTGAFNLNLLTRINRVFGTNLSHHRFRHCARYNKNLGRIEMSLISLTQQRVSLEGQIINFAPGERIITEYSYKYGLGEFAKLAANAGWTTSKAWTDPKKLFSIHYLVFKA